MENQQLLQLYSKFDLVYLAGIIDGEGSIAFTDKKVSSPNYYYGGRINLTIYNTYIPLLKWIQYRFGGSLHIIRRKNQKWKPMGSIHFGSKRSSNILEKVLPFLIVKQEQARIAIAFHGTRMKASEGMKNGLPESVLHLRKSLACELKQLNSRNMNHAL